MERNFPKALAAVLKHEGGFVDHPDDPGGATNKGVTIATFRRYVKPGGTVADLKAISDAQIATVYRRHYWDAVRATELPDGVDYAVFDFAVNSGPSRAIKSLQKVVDVEQDGRIGPATMAAVGRMAPVNIVAALGSVRMNFLRGLKKTWPTFGKGWTRRVDGVTDLGIEMTKGKPAAVVVRAPVEPVQPKPEPTDFWSWLAGLFSGKGAS